MSGGNGGRRRGQIDVGGVGKIARILCIEERQFGNVKGRRVRREEEEQMMRGRRCDDTGNVGRF